MQVFGIFVLKKAGFRRNFKIVLTSPLGFTLGPHPNECDCGGGRLLLVPARHAIHSIRLCAYTLGYAQFTNRKDAAFFKFACV